MKKFVFASDHAGFPLKMNIIEHFKHKGIECIDLGCYSEDSVDYPDFGHRLAEEVLKGGYDSAFAFCGSGNGISMSLNRHRGIRAAICWSAEIAALARKHNNANVCVFPGRFCGIDDAIEIAEVFCDTSFEGDRHQRRIDKIEQL